MAKRRSISSRGGLLWRKGKGGLLPMMKKLLFSSSSRDDEKGVKEGHFVVIATQGWKEERFFIELGHLDNPDFVQLLKQAEEEYGFSQEGALAIPCDPLYLKTIISTKN
ncbi:auxin-responsive protein SAUR50-like [Arachis ipaensis]|uniref:Auxin-induced protein n=2 Tax=Arachis hypogaea TaxID=3818 RepID=A0A444YNH6_ARAHY|nr:auxin-responsive protein SAUR50-like [Arachis ipaensis]XP_025661434.1 auxin-responsive protein SAUR50-like [Arachis hypogaea]RYR03503.1 hypothetical protein Ahy_B06g082491 isoform A [Arachis hypogaea]